MTIYEDLMNRAESYREQSGNLHLGDHERQSLARLADACESVARGMAPTEAAKNLPQSRATLPLTGKS
jgi:hypothetical protein